MPLPPGSDSPVDAASANVLAALVRCTREAWLLVDADGRLQWCNPATEALLGLDLARLAGQPWQDALPAAPSARQVLREAAAQLLRGQACAETEVQLSATGAHPAWVLLTANPLPSDRPGQPEGHPWLVVMHDVTAARRFEHEVRRLAERLETAQALGRIGVWERETASGTGHWDRHVFGLWGLDPTLGTPSLADALQRIHPEDRARMAELAATHQSGRHTQRFRVQHADGSTRWIRAHWELKGTASGEPERLMGIMMDDSDVHELSRSLGDTSARLKLAIELGNIAIWRHDLQTDRVQFNDRAHRVMSVPSSAEGLPLAEIRARVHPDDLPRLAASAQRALGAGDQPFDIEARFRRGDGTWRTLLTRRVLERGPDGAPRAWVGISLDVTEQAEQRRRATEAMRRMEAAAAAAGVGVWSHDTATGTARWNEPMFALVGRSPTLGVPSRSEWYEHIVHPADRDRMAAMLDTPPGQAGEQPFRITLPGGEVRWLENRVRSELLDGHPTVFGVTLDITDRRRAEDALRNADERAALAARGAGIGTWEVNFQGDAEHWDEQMFRLRGLEPRQRPPTRTERLALVHPDDIPQLFDSCPDAAANADPAEYMFRVRWPDGSYRWLASRSSAVLDETGRPLRRIGVNWDITETRLAEAARHDTVLAQRENLAKTLLLSRVSHELRTPLNAVLGFTQLLQAETGVPAEQRARLGWIRTAGEHLLLLIDDMLDLSGLALGDLKLNPQAVPLAELIAATVPLLAPLAAQQGVTLEIGATDGVAWADRTRLRQVLINLLSNGIKYNRAQGRVTVLAVGAEGKVTLRVDDSGRGLTSEQAAHLFEPFNRLGAESEGIEGSGIGLVIVKTLVERMGGAVRVTSRPGQGTCFQVELPAADAAPRPEPLVDETTQPAPVPAPAPHRNRLLYIEDNPVNMLLVQELLTLRPGLELVAAATGEEGVQQAIATCPTLVLVDMQLPDFDGFEVLRRLRAEPRTAALRCVALSANALPDEVARALAAGFADYWTKPIHFGRFLAALDAAFATDRI